MHGCACMLLKSDALWERTWEVVDKGLHNPSAFIMSVSEHTHPSPALPLATTHLFSPKRILKSDLELIGKSLHLMYSVLSLCFRIKPLASWFVVVLFSSSLNKMPRTWKRLVQTLAIVFADVSESAHYGRP